MKDLHEANEALRQKNAREDGISRCRYLFKAQEKVLTAMFILSTVALPIHGMCNSLDTHVPALAVYAQNTPSSTVNAPPPADEGSSGGPTVKRVLTTFEFWLSLEVLLFGVAGFSNNGGQGGAGAHYVAAYKVGSGCQMLDTATGIVTGDWGTRGAVPTWTSMTDSDGILLHTVNLNKAGDYVIIIAHVPSCPTCGSNGVYFWQIGTTNVTQPSGNLGGHLTEGFSHWINGAGQTGQFQSRLFATPGARTEIIPVRKFPPGLAPPFDLHTSWNTADPLDTNPFCLTEYNAPHPIPNVAWYKEIMCISPVNGTVWRFAHTFDTNKSHRFNDLDAIGVLSQDGRFYMWSSDWMGTLGSESGSPTCVVGKDCRGDVFVVELK